MHKRFDVWSGRHANIVYYLPQRLKDQTNQLTNERTNKHTNKQARTQNKHTN